MIGAGAGCEPCPTPDLLSVPGVIVHVRDTNGMPLTPDGGVIVELASGKEVFVACRQPTPQSPESDCPDWFTGEFTSEATVRVVHRGVTQSKTITVRSERRKNNGCVHAVAEEVTFVFER